MMKTVNVDFAVYRNERGRCVRCTEVWILSLNKAFSSRRSANLTMVYKSAIAQREASSFAKQRRI